MDSENTATPARGAIDIRADAGPLLLCCPALFGPRAVLDLLRQDDRVAGLLEPDAARAALESAPDQRLLLLYEDCVGFMARSMAEHGSPEAAAEAWKAAIRPVLALLRQNRRRSVLVRLSALLTYPDVFGSRMQVSGGTTERIAGVSRSLPDPTRQVLADYHFLQSPELRRLTGELDGSAVDLSNGAPEPWTDTRAVWRHLQDLENLPQALREEIDAQAREVERLNAELAQLGEEKTRQEKTSAAEHDMLQQMMQQVQHQLETSYGELRQTQAALREQREHGKAAHDKAIEYMVENEKVQAEKERVTRKLAEAEAWIAAVQASRSYRIMQPMRRLRAVFGRRG